MERPNTGRCRSPRALACGAAIQWARTANDELMPVDAEPNREGNVSLYRDKDTEAIRAVVLGPLELELLKVNDDEEQEELHTAHFARCPEADKWRKR